MLNNQNQIGIDVDTIPKETCKKCGSIYYDQVSEIHRLSQLDPRNPTPQDQLVIVPVYLCHECGWRYGEQSSLSDPDRKGDSNMRILGGIMGDGDE